MRIRLSLIGRFLIFAAWSVVTANSPVFSMV